MSRGAERQLGGIFGGKVSSLVDTMMRSAEAEDRAKTEYATSRFLAQKAQMDTQNQMFQSRLGIQDQRFQAQQGQQSDIYERQRRESQVGLPAYLLKAGTDIGTLAYSQHKQKQLYGEQQQALDRAEMDMKLKTDPFQNIDTFQQPTIIDTPRNPYEARTFRGQSQFMPIDIKPWERTYA